MALQAQRIGPYELLTPIGAGGMGEVWKARDTRLDRIVAIKFSQAQFSDRFQREARAIAAINHPNIAQIYDVGENYIVMEFIEGEPVRPPDNTRKLLDIAVQIADGLAAAHTAGFVHRDLKPDNILMAKSGRVKILDFGLAKQTAVAADDKTRTIAITDPGGIVGTIAYMSPEQARGEELDARSDQFSFGLVLYELATGKRAFQRSSAPETLTAIIREDPEPLPASVPAPLRWILERLLSKDAADRFGSTRDLYLDLRALQTRVSEVNVSATAAAAAPAIERPKAWRLAAGLVLAILLLAAVWRIGVASAPWRADLSTYRFQPFALERTYKSSLAWSPDGASLAYVSERNDGDSLIVEIVIQKRNGGVPFTVLRNRSRIFQLSWSPDATRIFYLDSSAQGRPFSIALAGGQPEPLNSPPRVSSMAVSPDGTTLAFLTAEDLDNKRVRRVWLSTPPGSAPKPIPNVYAPCCRMGGTGLFWFPDSNRLLVATRADSGQEYRVVDRSGVSRIAGRGEQWAAAVLPDGKHALTIAGRLSALNLEDGSTLPLSDGLIDVNATALARDGRVALSLSRNDTYVLEIPIDGTPPHRKLSSGTDHWDADWSAATGEIAYCTRGEIRIRSRDGSQERTLVTLRELGAPDGDLRFIQPAFSPDGTRLAYTVGNWPAGQRSFISPVGGGPATRIDGPDEEVQISWSPDGQWLAYQAETGTGAHFGTRKMRVGSSAQPIHLDHATCPPWWSPDGKWILCPGLTRIHLIPADGGPVQWSVEGFTAPAAFSLDGSAIYATRVNKNEVVRVDIRTRQASHVNYLRGESFRGMSEPPRFSLSPDGKSLLANAAYRETHIYLLDGLQPPASFWGRLWPLMR